MSINTYSTGLRQLFEVGLLDVVSCGGLGRQSTVVKLSDDWKLYPRVRRDWDLLKKSLASGGYGFSESFVYD
jgi:hypothetical protein